jgi:hypothetical protein
VFISFEFIYQMLSSGVMERLGDINNKLSHLLLKIQFEIRFVFASNPKSCALLEFHMWFCVHGTKVSTKTAALTSVSVSLFSNLSAEGLESTF